ncbi:Alpha/Beta hydrolase protein [Phakopsora pachyrhizi]|uniref:Alpha/Beta hydrolase protein n=1 Tax=Phakopsora pachyrhizi TaxID=170000 RepID=A0AAV0B4F1_PHAPC|nr:Alpha/Beta hydrolase protein [Phakopsora pachyrhizi]CAH7677551.1 Alpha/Beta hydrolase protein [Phakopsora pachyrhizi]
MEQRDVFVCGHSLGGFSALSYAGISSLDLGIKDFRAKLKGVIAVSPMIDVARETMPNYPTQCFIRGLAKCLPTLKISDLPISKRRHCADASNEIRFQNDPQTFHGTLRLSTAPALLDGVKFIKKEGSNLNVPFIIFHGEKDEVTDCSSSKKFYEEAKATNKQFKVYYNMNHSLIMLDRNENIHEITEVLLQEMIDWMKNILESGNSLKISPISKSLSYDLNDFFKEKKID